MTLLKTFTGRIEFRETKIVSENYMYKPTRGGRGMYKVPAVADYQYNVTELARRTDLSHVAGEFKDKSDEVEIRLHFDFHLNRNPWNLDVSNMVKATEDALVQLTQIDDSVHRAVSSEKHRSTTGFEFIDVKYEVYERSPD